MRTSHRQIRKRILDAKSKISDEEFFSSRAYNGYLTDLAEAATKRYKRPLRVRVVADHDDDTSILYGLVRSGISTSVSIVAVVLSATWTAL